MRYFLFFILCFSATFKAFSTNFYIGKNGNDANNGLSPAQAWKTLVPLASVSYSPSDSVLLERGGIYRGKITINQSGNSSAAVVISAYGAGIQPIISGSELLTNWTLHTGNIYTCNFSQRPQQIYVDGKLMRKARYPNSGWLRVGTSISNVSFSDSTLTQNNGYWVGADVVLRVYSSGISRRRVSAFSNQTFTFEQAYGSSPQMDYGYCIENKFSELDAEGEWFCDTVSSKVYLIFPAGSSPASSIVEGSVENEGIRVEWKRSYIVINQINFKYQVKNGIYLNNNRNVKVQNSIFQHQGEYGIVAWSGAFNRVESNQFSDMYHGAVIYFGDSSRIEKNKVERSGVFFGLGNNSYITPALCVGGVRNIVQFNHVDSAGGAALIQYGYADTVRFNYFTNSCALSNYNTAFQIGEDSLHWVQSNIIDQTGGNIETLPANNQKYCYGIYLGRNVGLNHFIQNTIANSSGSGIRLNSSRQNIFTGNTMYNNYEQMRCDDSSEPTYFGDYQNSFQDNILFALSSSQDVFYEVTYNTTPTPSIFLNSNNNYLFNPYSEILNYQVYSNPTIRKRHSLERLRSELNRDLNSKKTFISRPLYHVQDTTGSNLILNSDFGFTITDWSIWPQDAALSWQNNFPGFSGGYLSVFGQGASSTSWGLTHGLIDFEKDSCYAMSFKLASDGFSEFRIEARRASSPWNVVGLSDYFPGYDTSHYNSFVFKATENVNPGMIQFTNTNAYPNYKIDDVRLFKVKALYDDPKNNFILCINPTQQAQTINLGSGTFYDVQQNVLSSSFTLAPYQTKIAIRAGTIPNLNAEQVENEPPLLKIYPIPARSESTITLENFITGNVSIHTIEGKMVYSTYLASTGTQTQLSLPVLTPGLYFIKSNHNQLKLLIL